MSLTFTAAIPTYQRERDLDACLESIIAQSRLPDEVLIVDDAALPDAFVARWRERLRGAGVTLSYRRKDHSVERRGLSESRNLALRIATGEVLFFFDDDVVLEPAFFAEIMRVWDEDRDPTLLGVGGLIRNSRRKGAWERAYNAAFGLGSEHSWDVTPVAYTVWDEGIEAPVKGYYVHGGVNSMRRADAARIGYATFSGGRTALEDLDFCMKAKALGFHFILVPQAKVLHNHSPAAREDDFLIGMKESQNRLEIYRNFGLKTLRGRLWFAWSAVGWNLRLLAGLRFAAMAGRLYGFFARPPR